MAKSRTAFRCTNCNHTTARWLGQCPTCSEWHTLEEVEVLQEKKTRERHKVEVGGGGQERLVSLSEIEFAEQERMSTGIGEFDRVLGGGLMPASLILLGGDPGIGKSTLMLHLAKASPDLNLLYVAGEESAGQIRQRADRIGVVNSRMKVLNVTDLDRIVSTARQEKPDLLVIDSIQTIYRSELASLPGSTQQVRECAAVLQQLAKREDITTLMIGHVTKEGELAGPKILEHTVDTVLQFEGDQSRFHRILRSVKNRFGSAQEVGVFSMGEQGLEEVSNPSALFLSEMDDGVSGNAVACIMEGSRPLMVEVQALVTTGSYGTPQRTTSGFDQRRLSLLLAVLEKRAGMKFSNLDVYLNIAGGLRISDRAADLAVAGALASSYRERPVKADSFLLGEIGLGGEIRRVPRTGQRIREGQKLGFKRCIAPLGDQRESPESGIDLKRVRYLGQALDVLLS